MYIFSYFREFGVDRDRHRGDVHVVREFLVTEFWGYVVPKGFLRHIGGGPRRFLFSHLAEENEKYGRIGAAIFKAAFLR